MSKTSIKEENKDIIDNDIIEKEKIEVIKKENSWKQYLWHIPLIAVILMLLLFSMRYFNYVMEVYSFESYKIILTTFVVWICEYLVVKGVTNRTKISLGIVVGVEVIYDIINYAVRTVRGSAITVSDIHAIKTALSVSKNVSLQYDNKLALGIAYALAIIAIIIIFKDKFVEKKSSYKFRITKVVIGFAVIIALSQTNIYNTFSLWDVNANYRVLGTPVTILRMLHNFNVKHPKGHNKAECENILKQYESKENVKLDEAEGDTDKPNIIVIVNESFCDYYNLYKDGYADPIEYITELSKQKNVISGVMYSSEYGGQTSNVEYEFLTQNSTKILPVGSYVFQQYISRPIKSSIVQTLKQQGYKTSAIHPWENFAYSRNKIYKYFGFDSIKFKDDMEGLEPNFNNDFFSDKSAYKELMKEIKSKKEGEKIFDYILTVQNHTGYTNPDPNQITYNDDVSKNVYMQLIHESAEALKEVVDELKKSDEKYILLFFGDHQPNLDGEDTKEERNIENYEIPFIIWANYDIEEQYNIETSTIFLQNYLLKAAGVQYSAMNNYMEELQKTYPVITKKFYKDTNGNIFKNEDTSSENYSKIEEYNKMDYYMIFDNNK